MTTDWFGHNSLLYDTSISRDSFSVFKVTFTFVCKMLLYDKKYLISLYIKLVERLPHIRTQKIIDYFLNHDRAT